MEDPLPTGKKDWLKALRSYETFDPPAGWGADDTLPLSQIGGTPAALLQVMDLMTAIIGQSEFLLKDLPRDSALACNAWEIRKSAANAATLARQLLANHGKPTLPPENLNLNLVLTNLVSFLPPVMGLNVTMRVVPAMKLRLVRVAAVKIEQVILNIASYARDAMPHGGQLTLETANVTLPRPGGPELQPGDYVTLTITDSGPGLEEEILKRLFEPFPAPQGISIGAGTGLAASYAIVKQYGGHIDARSEPARGTTFTIYLPQSG